MGSRRIVGFALGEHHDAALAYAALAMAIAVRGGKQAIDGVIFHSDQGSEYTAGSFRAACARLGVRQSIRRLPCGATMVA
jgi:putative transposase